MKIEELDKEDHLKRCIRKSINCLLKCDSDVDSYNVGWFHYTKYCTKALIEC